MLTPEEQMAEDAYYADLHREAYDAVAGSDLGQSYIDARIADEERRGHEANCEPYSAVAGNAGEEGFLL
jgi:hypothetical protein